MSSRFCLFLYTAHVNRITVSFPQTRRIILFKHSAAKGSFFKSIKDADHRAASLVLIQLCLKYRHEDVRSTVLLYFCFAYVYSLQISLQWEQIFASNAFDRQACLICGCKGGIWQIVQYIYIYIS